MVTAQRLEGNHFLCVDSNSELWMPQQQQQFFFFLTSPQQALEKLFHDCCYLDERTPFKALEHCRVSRQHIQRESLYWKRKYRRQKYIWRSCSSFLVGVCCILILLLFQKYIWRNRSSFLVEEKHIVDMCVLTKSNLFCFCNCMIDGASLLLKQT